MTEHRADRAPSGRHGHDPSSGSDTSDRGPVPRQASRAALNDWIRALLYKQSVDANPDRTLLSVIREIAAGHGDNVAVVDETGTLSYRGLVNRSDAFSRWALQQGLGKGDVVALMMHNAADYIAIWLGITQIGCAVALINTNLIGNGLAHSIRVAGAGNIIVDAAFVDPVNAVIGQLPEPSKLWLHGAGEGAEPICLDHEPNGAPEIPHDRQPRGYDRALLIYTSGTTGAPKAANVSHARVLEWGLWFAGMMDTQPDDRMYNCLPMYHSVGGVVATGAMLARGGSVLIRKRFSASRFWTDVAEGDCTIFQYIGELCRYLLQTPPHPDEKAHRLRLCCGNGLRGDVWPDFQKRFNLPRILEFYAATEGNVSLYNCEGKPGAIGRIPGFLADRFPVALIRVDRETGDPARDADGRCIRCLDDEPGEAIGQIVTQSRSPARHFDGYTDPDATSRKVLDNVFVAGDRWFRTGDLMRKDNAGYFYFVDRLGDTFRWKGENVSTTEVAAAVSACPGVTEATVYGVALPGMEGRAGMAAITTDSSFRFDALRQHLTDTLPHYARPVFVRLCQELPITGTFKLAKATLARDGLEPSTDQDAVWVFDQSLPAFVRFSGVADQRRIGWPSGYIKPPASA